ncbi:RNA-directed DNA polymerase (Reverse transcriptase), partial [Trifolium medium]|nr:RNA-directed DNA polymerase (Reverse transcriptase) [Trifolium medium]
MLQTYETRSMESIKLELKEILEQYAEVFQDKITLPPERPQVHQIKLLPDHGPVSVRPYKYPHHQKEEIERQVHELLQAGVIRPSASAFSSPV